MKRYPASELTCTCEAFPWPHAYLLSRRCEARNTEVYANDHLERWDEPSEDERLDDPRRGQASGINAEGGFWR